MAAVAIVTGSGGLVGSESARQFASLGYTVVGIDNDMRSFFFGPDASTRWQVDQLKEEIPGYIHCNFDIREMEAVDRVFAEYGSDIRIIIHAAAQPSHDWAARAPLTDFGVNAAATLNLLEAARKHCPQASFIYCSTNKVYGDRPNTLPLIELDTRWELSSDHPFYEGIDESMSVDGCKHSIFGASKLAADIMVQEYGLYFGMSTACFRGGCLTGPAHSGAMLHGFLSYLLKCAVTGAHYSIFGYKGKQVRDNIHSSDLVKAFICYHRKPRPASVYNIGGGRGSNCSVLEAIAICEELTGKRLQYTLVDDNRIGDHIWWISSTKHFEADYPEWRLTYGISSILQEILEYNQARW